MKMRTVKPMQMKDMAMPSSGIMPSLHIPLNNLPEAKDWKIGEKYTLAVEVKQTSIDKDSVRFEITKIGVEESDAAETPSENKADKKTKRYA